MRRPQPNSAVEQQPATSWSWSARRSVVACLIGASLSASCVFIVPFGLYLKPMSAEFGWSRSQLTLGLSVVSLVAVLATPMVGWMLDRVSARSIAWVGVVSLPLGLLGFAMLPADYGTYIALCVTFGLIVAINSPMVYLFFLPQWIDHRLGLAISLGMLGLGLGQAVGSIGSGQLIAAVGWRSSLIIVAMLVALGGTANCALLLRENPAYRRTRALRQSLTPLPGMAFREATRTPLLWLLMASAAAICITGSGTATHIAAILTDGGAPIGRAAAALTLIGLGSICGRLVTGFALDRFAFGLVGTFVFTFQALGILILSSGGVGGFALLAMFLIGTGLGAEADIIPFAIRRRFGLRAYGRLFGMVFAAYQIGPIAGPLLMAQSFDRLGSYRPMLLAFVALAMTAALLIALAGYLSRKSISFTDPVTS